MIKRLFDIVVVLITAPFWAPLLLFVAILVRVKLGSPVLFRQKRPGLHGEIFEIMKFRSMTDARGPDGQLLSDAERLPAFGKWLRSTSLDELPELLNILKGDMSLVGPRPLLVQFLPLYNAEQARRHDVIPGLTGWAQINGRNAISWDEKFRLDVWYVDNWSLWLDIKILAITFIHVFDRRGITSPGQATFEYFTGNKPK
jgi:sugar transferase EpsL